MEQNDMTSASVDSILFSRINARIYGPVTYCDERLLFSIEMKKKRKKKKNGACDTGLTRTDYLDKRLFLPHPEYIKQVVRLKRAIEKDGVKLFRHGSSRASSLLERTIMTTICRRAKPAQAIVLLIDTIFYRRNSPPLQQGNGVALKAANP